jgi:hypothetical protein
MEITYAELVNRLVEKWRCKPFEAQHMVGVESCLKALLRDDLGLVADERLPRNAFRDSPYAKFVKAKPLRLRMVDGPTKRVSAALRKSLLRIVVDVLSSPEGFAAATQGDYDKIYKLFSKES